MKFTILEGTGVGSEVLLEDRFIESYKSTPKLGGTTIKLKPGDKEVFVKESVEDVKKEFEKNNVFVPNTDEIKPL